MIAQITQTEEPYPAVRVAALRALIKCTQAVKFIPTSDANIFPEYILPRLARLCHDKNGLVRAEFAANLAEVSWNIIFQKTQLTANRMGRMKNFYCL